MSSATELKVIADAIQRSVSEVRSKVQIVGEKHEAELSSKVPPAERDSTALASLRESVDELERQASLLRDKVKPRKGIKSHFGEIKDLTTFFFSFFALSLSLISLLLTYFWLKPDIQLIKGSAVEITWAPKANELRLGFQITVANYGRRMDVVKSMEAELAPVAAQFQPIHFTSGTGDFTLKPPAKTELNFPFTVAEKTAMDVNTTVSQVVGTTTRESLFQKPSPLGASRKFKLEVHVYTASDKAAATEFCFETPDYLLGEIAAGDAKEITTEECRGGQ